MFSLIGIAFFIWFNLSGFCRAASIEVKNLANEVAFLRNGEVYYTDKDGRKTIQVTETGGKVEDFLFSPDLKHLAYSKIISYADEPGLFEEGEEIPKRPVCSIVIEELENRKVLKEIMPAAEGWIYLSKWLPGGKLSYYCSSGFDVSGYFEYDIQKNTESELDFAKGHTISEADFYSDGSIMTYVDDSGVGVEYKQNLHLVDLKSGSDKIITSSKSILDNRISNDKKQVAFVETENTGNEYYDSLWICAVQNGSLKRIYRGPAKAKSGGVSELGWSFDDLAVGMFFSLEASIIEIQYPDRAHKIAGSDFNWIENKILIFSKGAAIYSHDLSANKTELFQKAASKPAFLVSEWDK